MSDGRRYDTGDTIKLPSGREFEVTGVGYQETDGKRHSFSYTIRDKEELAAEKAELEKREAELRKATEEAATAQAKAEEAAE